VRELEEHWKLIDLCDSDILKGWSDIESLMTARIILYVFYLLMTLQCLGPYRNKWQGDMSIMHCAGCAGK
jgi:hypothetical protein